MLQGNQESHRPTGGPSLPVQCLPEPVHAVCNLTCERAQGAWRHAPTAQDSRGVCPVS